LGSFGDPFFALRGVGIIAYGGDQTLDEFP
jgi:hypothetical protein